MRAVFMGSTSGFFLGMAAILLMPFIAHFVLAQNDPSDWVALHNSERTAVGVGPVSWDVDVAAFAESYASQQIECKTLQHSGTTLYGENIFWSSDPAATASDAMLSWAGEAQNFNFNTKTCAVGAVCGHYTQVVWRDSTAIGCARSACGGGVFMTCNYSPPGNIIGQDPF